MIEKNISIISKIRERNSEEKVLRHIKKVLKEAGNSGNAIEQSLSAYLLYKVSSKYYLDNHFYSLIEDEQFGIDDSIKEMTVTYLNEHVWERLVKMMEYESFRTEDFLAVILSEKLFSVAKKREIEHVTPKHVIELALHILEINDEDIVADVCSGVGNFILEGSIQNPKTQFYGFENNNESISVAKMRAEIVGDNIHLYRKDIFEFLDIEGSLGRFDKIFSHFPVKVDMRYLRNKEVYHKLCNKYLGLKESNDSSWFFSAAICEMLADDNSRAVCIVPNGSLCNSISEEVRKDFIEKGLIECIVELPEKFIPGTLIETSLIVFSKNNEKNIKIIDAKALGEKERKSTKFSNTDIEYVSKSMHMDTKLTTIIDYNLICENDFILNKARYLKDEIKIKNGKKFEQVIKNIRRGAALTAQNIDNMITNEVTNCQLLMVSNINNGRIDTKLQSLNNVEKRLFKYMVKDGEFILSRNSTPFRVAVASVKDNHKILANSNVYMIELDTEQLNPYFLLAFFGSETGEALLNSMSAGTRTAVLGINDIKNMTIPVPKKEVQDKIAKEYFSKLQTMEELKNKVQIIENELKEVFNKEMEKCE